MGSSDGKEGKRVVWIESWVYKGDGLGREIFFVIFLSFVVVI